MFINSAKIAFSGETLAHKLRDRYQLPIKMCIYVKSNALITSEDISVIVENFWQNFGKCFFSRNKV
jgi:hypothetical protein